MIAPDAFRTRLEPGKWPKLEQASETMHKALADFIHGGDADSAGRTVAVSTLLFSLWELAGSSMTLQPPSLVLITAHDGSGIAPMDALAAQLVKTGNCKRRLKSAAGGTEWCGGRKVRHLQINHGGCSLICSNGPRYAAEF